MDLSSVVTSITTASNAATAAALNINGAIQRIQNSPNPNQINTIGSVVKTNSTLANTPLWEVAAIGGLGIIVVLIAFILIRGK